MRRTALSKHEYINLILLQYQPLDNVSDNISKIELLLKKNNVKENTLVVCPELSLQRYVCITKTKKNISNAISLDSEEISLIKNIAIKYRIFLCITIFEKLKKKCSDEEPEDGEERVNEFKPIKENVVEINDDENEVDEVVDDEEEVSNEEFVGEEEEQETKERKDCQETNDR